MLCLVCGQLVGSGTVEIDQDDTDVALRKAESMTDSVT